TGCGIRMRQLLQANLQLLAGAGLLELLGRIEHQRQIGAMLQHICDTPHSLKYKQPLAAAIFTVGGQRADMFDMRIGLALDHPARWTCSTTLRNPAGSRTAMSASTLRSRSMPASFRPLISRLYEMPFRRAAALIRMIQRRRKSRFLLRRSR